MDKLYSLQFITTSCYKTNLQTLLALVDSCKENSLIVAPEVCLTGFDYDNYDEALSFATVATKQIAKHSTNKIVILTMLEKRDGEVYNFAKVFYNGQVVFERAKARLFRFGGEHNYMSEGSDEDFKIVEVAGVKIAIFICFELRFKELWQKSEGADVIVTPSWWGKARSEHFEAITQTLAIINQCFVVASDSANESCTALSGIVTPQGKAQRNGNKACLELPYEPKEIKLMRRYLDVGIG